jgi:hypothetical protein
MPLDAEKKEELFDHYYKKLLGCDIQKYNIERLKNFIISNEKCDNLMYLKLFLHFSMLKNPEFCHIDYTLLEHTQDFEELFEAIVDFYSNNGFHKNIIVKALGYLSVTRCGLSAEELSKVCSHSESVESVLEVFKVCLYTYDNLWMFKSDVFGKIILNKYNLSYVQLHVDIIESAVTNKITVRGAHEKIFHYRESKEWMALKDAICMLEMFFIMYTPQYRFELFKCWSLLREHHYDPVQEYNKTLEQFVEQYKPNNQAIFIIMVQFCRFFKEFSELETTDLCDFRHPPIKRLHEIKELRVYDEVKDLEGFISQDQINPLRKDESFTVENKKYRITFKEAIIGNDDSDDESNYKTFNTMSLISKNKICDMYHYKRWVWIQFPWFALDVYSDFSQIMSVFNRDDMNFQNDNEMAISTLKTIKETKEKGKKRYNPTKKSLDPMTDLDRSVTAIVKSSNLLQHNPPSLNTTLQLNPINEKTLSRQLTRGATTDNLNKRNKTEYNFDLMFKELTPANVLLKVGAKVADYSNHEILKKKKENYELQTHYNRLVNESRIKNLQLESIKSQITKSEDKMKEGKEIAVKIEGMKKKMEKIYEKINKAEVESKRLEQIISCCFKNTARNELWEKGLEKGIQNIKDIIEIEKNELIQYQNEEQLLNDQINEFEHWFQDKIKIQENTLDRVAEQFSFKASIKETLINGENKRNTLLSFQSPPRSENYLTKKLNDRKKVLKKVLRLKEVLETKINSFEIIIQKLQNVATINGPQDLTSIIWELERNQELLHSRLKLDDKLKDLKGQKEALDLKLTFLKKKEMHAGQDEIIPEIAIHTINELEKKINNYSEVCKKQEIIYFGCEGIINHLLNLVGAPAKVVDRKKYKEILKMIGDKVLSMGKERLPHLTHSKTLKVNTLQVPYSSKFNIVDATTPYGPEALINTPLKLSPAATSESRMSSSIPRKRLVTLAQRQERPYRISESPAKKGILKVPKY